MRLRDSAKAATADKHGRPRRRRKELLRYAGSILALSVGCNQAVAQSYSGGSLPVIDMKPDLNGVDVASGQISVNIPFQANAPGASKLNAIVNFNGRMITNSIFYYLEDQTVTRPDTGDYNNRQIRIHISNLDMIFTCEGIGNCTQVGEKNGSLLIRLAEKRYELVTSDGTIVKFFDMLGQDIYPSPCMDVETGCNAAKYFGYSWAESVKSPNGEKIIFSPYSKNVGTNLVLTASSNLGYVYEVVTPCAGSCTVGTEFQGRDWLSFRSAMPSVPPSVTFNLKFGSNTISSVNLSHSIQTINQAAQAKTVAYEDNFVATDQLNRSFKMTLQSRWYGSCGTTLTADGKGVSNWVSGYGQSSFDSSNFVPTEIKSPAGRITTVRYLDFSIFSQGLNYVPVTSVTKSGSTWLYDYDSSRWFASAVSMTMTDPTARKTTNKAQGWDVPWETVWGNSYWCNTAVTGYDTIESKDNKGNLRKASYASQGAIEKFRMPEDNGYDYSYDPRGNVTSVRLVPKAGKGESYTVYEAFYPSDCSNFTICNKPLWTKDAKQGRTDYEYNEVHGGTIKITQPADSNGNRPVKKFYYTPWESAEGLIYRISSSTECLVTSDCSGKDDELKREFTYWGSTFLTTTESVQQGPKGKKYVTIFEYDSSGRVTKRLSPEGSATWSFYDAAGRKVAVVRDDPDGIGPLGYPAEHMVYNNDDQVENITKGNVSVVNLASVERMAAYSSLNITYDTQGRKIRDAYSTPSQVWKIVQFSYDAAGRLECTAERMNTAAYAALPEDACSQEYPGTIRQDRITRNAYDQAGQLELVTKGYGTALAQSYATYTHSPNGKRLSLTDANGNRAEMRYDGYDRQSAWYFPSKTTAGVASSDDYEVYEYDANGNRTSLRKRDGSQLTFEYDALNRMTVKRVPKGCGPNRIGGCPDSTATNDVYYGYDLRGLQTYARFGSHQGEGVTNVYDGFGHLIKTTTAMAKTSRVVSAEYDGNGNRTELKTPGGTWTYAYDGLDRMNGLYEGVGTSTVMSTWTYNAQGLPQAVVERSGSGATWGYDGSGRLNSQNDTFAGGTGNVGVTLDYNPASQIVSRTRNNEDYAFAGKYEVSRKYEKNGLNQYTTAGPATFSYDVNGNLIADGKTTYIYDAENRLVKAGETSLTYDPLGRLFQVSGSSGSTQFLYDGDQLVAEYDGAGSLTNAYVHGPGEDDPLLWYPAGEAARWYHRDHQGSIVATASGPSGTLAGINTYDEYGIPGAGNRGRFQYTGQAFIPELGMYHYKARVYSPTLGRFLQTDPIGYDDQVNLYAYVANDPVNGTDPTGTRIHVNGSRGEKAALKAAILAAAKSSPALLARYNAMVSSKLVAEIYAIPKGQMPYNSPSPPPPLSNDASNGRGSNTQAGIDLGGTTKGDGMLADAATQAAHEVLSHGFDTMFGVLNDQVDPRTGVPVSEERGVRGENEYRRATNQPIRGSYSGSDVTSSGATKPLPTPDQCRDTTGKIAC